MTLPFLQLSVATVRVLNTRIAQSHLSILTSVFMSVWPVSPALFVIEIAHGSLQPGKNECADCIACHIHPEREPLALVEGKLPQHE